MAVPKRKMGRARLMLVAASTTRSQLLPFRLPAVRRSESFRIAFAATAVSTRTARSSRPSNLREPAFSAFLKPPRMSGERSTCQGAFWVYAHLARLRSLGFVRCLACAGGSSIVFN